MGIGPITSRFCSHTSCRCATTGLKLTTYINENVISSFFFQLSKMYEEYLEDYVYKLMSKVASRLCRVFKSKVIKNPETQTDIQKEESSKEITNSEIPKAIENKKPSNNISQTDNKSSSNLLNENETEKNKNKCDSSKSEHIDEDLNNINFHMMMFFLWMIVTLVNVPALLTWARNFK